MSESNDLQHCPWCGVATAHVETEGRVTTYTCTNVDCDEYEEQWETVGLELKSSTTARGFRLIEFTDRYHEPCTLQASSLATEAAIWLGPSGRIDTPNPNGPGWVPVPVLDEWLVHSRMHLTQQQVQQLLPILQHFAETGELTTEVP
jgi:hypothetical protein